MGRSNESFSPASSSRVSTKEADFSYSSFPKATSNRTLAVPNRNGPDADENAPLLNEQRRHGPSRSSSVSRTREGIVTRSTPFLMLLTLSIGGCVQTGMYKKK